MAKKSIKFPKGTSKKPAKGSLTYNIQGPNKRRAVLDSNIDGNHMTVTIDYNYTNAPDELLELLDTQYQDAITALNGAAVTTAEEATKFLAMAADLLAAGVAEGIALSSEE